MRCTGYGCERKDQCARYYILAHSSDEKFHTLANLHQTGIAWINADGSSGERRDCGEAGNWGMFIPIVKTNAQKIRAMSDEELQGFICSVATCNVCKWGVSGGCDLLHWLQSPCEGGADRDD